MRKMLRLIAIFAAAIGFSAIAPSAATAQTMNHLEAGVDYDYVRANAPPGKCPCFSANGGDAWLGYKITSTLRAVGEVASQHAANISGSGEDLTLTSFMVGPRYSYRHIAGLVPFGEVLLGSAHASGSLSPSNTLNTSSNAFAMATGGGIDVAVTKRISVRAIRADYYLTTFTNGINDHQNNLRISAGMIYSFR